MLENSIYSVISPEGCSSILWRSSDFVEEAAESLKLTAENCLKFGIIDGIIDEIAGGAHRFIDEQIETVKNSILTNYDKLKNIPLEQLVLERNEKYLNITMNN
jgi:acetyl-CoA carboxylase carboxyl transferase subunit alpha